MFPNIEYEESHMKSSVLARLKFPFNKPLEKPKTLFSRKSEAAIQRFFWKQLFLKKW